MHKYLRAIGFSALREKKQIDDFFSNELTDSNLIASYKTEDQRMVGQFEIMVAPTIGISVIAEEDKGIGNIDFYFPFARGYDNVIVEECSIERHSDKEAYDGIIDDYRLGMAVIFYLTNVNDYNTLIKHYKDKDIKFNRVHLSALSLEGSVILPIQNKSNDNIDFEDTNFNRGELQDNNYFNRGTFDIGDKNALPIYESLQSNDMFYRTIIERYKKEDLFSIVESSIVPYGIECDKYLVVANILNVSQITNRYTNEKIYDIRVETLGIKFNICINEKDLVGEPKVGRRFRGVVWLMGDVEFVSKDKGLLY